MSSPLAVDHAKKVEQHEDHDDDGHDDTHQQATRTPAGRRIVAVFTVRLHGHSFPGWVDCQPTSRRAVVTKATAVATAA